MKFEFKNVSRGLIREMHLSYKPGRLHLILGSHIKVEESTDCLRLSLDLHTCTVEYMAELTHTHVTYIHAVLTKNINTF